MQGTRVGFLLLDGYALMSIAAAVEPLRAANLLSERELYAMRFISCAGTSAHASVGSFFETVAIAEAGLEFDIVFVVAGGNPFEIRDPAMDAWLRRLDRAGVRLGGISGGAAILAAAGLLAQRRFTVHWLHYDALLERVPDAMMERRIFVIDRDRYTCAGGVAPLDMMYNLIAADHGATFAHEVSDWFIHTQIRLEQNPQRAGLAERYGIHDATLIAALDIMENHIADPLEPAQLARLCGISVRHLHRLFANILNKSLGRFYTDMRVSKAKELLSQTPLPIIEVALATGFANISHFTRVFRAISGRTPAAFRAAHFLTASKSKRPRSINSGGRAKV